MKKILTIFGIVTFLIVVVSFLFSFTESTDEEEDYGAILGV